ncbi:segregation/condensation protein A [Candidatus Synechococcus spongiarum]|uniref:Segregation and condensation protein A n=1 Tax=Candidatus Synechococcus spongiarum TaxID=431041 RepID=A0A165B0N4_9SYNE|nr:segregation/condensation protein A [Candidatus Synechococcus spongiarum]SAY38705.1 Segregation and condensation protein A [Candidatus Synechococcus spongiarum]
MAVVVSGARGIRLGTTDGSRVAIRLLQEAAERGDLDPWDVDVIAVVDGFLDQLQVRMTLPRLASGPGGSYEQDLAESSEAFLAASVLVALKARILEQDILSADGDGEDILDDGDDLEAGGSEPLLMLPLRAEEHLKRRLVAPPLRRTVTLGELIQSLETMATQLEQQEATRVHRNRTRPFSRRHAVAQVAALAHREKLPETTAALDQFLDHWADGGGAFEELVSAWAQIAPDDLDRDRVGVFWALLFLCSQGRVDLRQEQGLYGPLTIRVLPCPWIEQEPRIRQEAQALPRPLAALRMAPPSAV